MTANDDEDPTVPGERLPEADGSEDLTVPSGKVPGSRGPDPEGDIEDPTVPMNADSVSKPPGDTDEVGTIAAADGKDIDLTPKALAAPSQLLGETIGGCRIDKLLGRGAMGAVYKARQLKLDRDVAVKVIRPEMMTDSRMLKRFEIEARTVGKFNSANVVMVHDVGFERGVHYLVMELVKGKNLRDHVKLLAGGRLPVGEALPLIRQACKGLEEARRLGVVHRDIKPDNLMLTDQDILKIADFGIAKPQEDFSMTLTSELIGTPLYMSPEQCQGGADVDFRSDMYSLGATFFYLLTGEPPIRASSVYELIQTKTRLENLCLWKSLPELDENNPLSRVIERMTANDRDDRYESYEELLNDLVLVEAGESITVRAKKLKKAIASREAERAEEVAAPKSSSGRWLALAALLVVGGGVAGYQLWPNEQPREVLPDPPGESPLVAKRLALKELGERLGIDGPNAGLREEVAQLEVPDALVEGKQRLLSDLDEGLRVQTALDALQVPEPAVPFDGVGAYFVTLDETAQVAPESGEVLRRWATARRNVRRKADALAIGEQAVAALEQGLADWRTDLAQFRGGEEDLQKLQGEMKVLRDARKKLIDLLPEQEKALDQALATRQLDELSLQLIRLAFLSDGSNPSLRLSAEQVDTADPGLRKQRSVLLEAMASFAAARYPDDIKAPEFLAIGPFRAARSEALKQAEDGRDLPEWLATKTQALLREGDLLREVVGILRQEWQGWQKARGNEASNAELTASLARLKSAVSKAKELFPTKAAAGALDDAVPLADLTKAESDLQAAMAKAEGDQRRDTWRTELKAANKQLDSLSLATWDEAEFQRKEIALADGLSSLDNREPLELGLQRFRRGCAEWKKVRRDVDAAIKLFAEGSLAQCLESFRKLSPPAGAKKECDELLALAMECQQAFEQVQEKLEVREAQKKLQSVFEKARAQSLTGVAKRVESWRDGVRKLDNAAAGMQPIAAGNSKKPMAGFVEKAFFMSKTECSVDEFKAFLQAAKAMDLSDVVARLPVLGGDEGRVRRILNMQVRGSGRNPVVANWYAAAAYCEWNNLSLPTRSEWALAAFGDDSLRKWPWRGDEMALQMPECNFGKSAVDVDEGSEHGVGMHHLAGNVAEWLQLKGDELRGFKAPCVGGGFLDTPRSAEKYASGVEVHEVNREMGRRDVGFRVVLRPSSFSGMRWPQGWQK